jgi:hypothetical protein
VGFVVDKVALGQVFLWVLWFSPTISFHQCFIFIHASSGGWTMGPLVAAVPQRHSLTSSQQQQNKNNGMPSSCGWKRWLPDMGIGVNMLNKCLMTAGKGWSSSLEA